MLFVFNNILSIVNFTLIAPVNEPLPGEQDVDSSSRANSPPCGQQSLPRGSQSLKRAASPRDQNNEPDYGSASSASKRKRGPKPNSKSYIKNIHSFEDIAERLQQQKHDINIEDRLNHVRRCSDLLTKSQPQSRLSSPVPSNMSSLPLDPEIPTNVVHSLLSMIYLQMTGDWGYQRVEAIISEFKGVSVKNDLVQSWYKSNIMDGKPPIIQDYCHFHQQVVGHHVKASSFEVIHTWWQWSLCDRWDAAVKQLQKEMSEKANMSSSPESQTSRSLAQPPSEAAVTLDEFLEQHGCPRKGHRAASRLTEYMYKLLGFQDRRRFTDYLYKFRPLQAVVSVLGLGALVLVPTQDLFAM